MLDQLTAEQVKVRASGTSTSQAAEARNSIEKPFSHWIQGAPKEKWSFLYDTNGMRYGIQTTNHAECFNMVMRSCRAFPLVGIVEFIMYGCIKKFQRALHGCKHKHQQPPNSVLQKSDTIYARED